MSNAENIDDYILALQTHPSLEGFTDEDGKRILEKWAKTSLMVISKNGRLKKEQGEQILHLQPLTYLTLKAGFPSNSSRLQNVHSFLYQLMIDTLKKEYDDDKDKEHKQAKNAIRDALRSAFADGIMDLQDVHEKEINGKYDGKTKLDTEMLLSIRFMEPFDPAKIGIRKVTSAETPVCEGQAKRFMQGFIKLITVFKDRMPARELTYNLQTLINFELCIYTLKLVHGTNHLVKNREIPPQYSVDTLPTKPQLYADLTHQAKGLSLDIARQCVSRDLQELSRFFTSLLQLRILDQFVSDEPDFKEDINGLSSQQYLVKLLELADNLKLQGSANHVIKDIKKLNEVNQSNESNIELKEFFERNDDLNKSDSIARLVNILDEAQRTKIGSNLFSWFRGVGGVDKDYGFIKGSKHRRTWAYSMSDDLLWTLVHLASVRPDERGKKDEVQEPKPLRLVEFLDFLENRYGVIIHKVPDGMGSIEANRAARENMLALQKRLRQMGLFENLSDDFEAQYITPQYREMPSINPQH
ncbi:MAG: hypothetical protein VSS75_012300 [Candidatus Parabeggiatoa sp.]|nr:hypothetical protein [Candidatus Parabeggiatoa sp.]